MRATRLLSATSSGVGMNVRQVGYGLAVSRYPQIYTPIKVKNKTIRVLLDLGSSGDLLFMKKGSSKRISVAKPVVSQLWGTSNGTLVTDRVGGIEILLWSTQSARRCGFSRTL
jgi:hypothetical protein